MSISPVTIQELGAQPAQCGQGNTEVGGNVAEIAPLANAGKLLYKIHIAFSGRKREPVLVRLVEPAVFVLMDDTPPVAQLQIGLEQAAHVAYRNPECPDGFQGLGIFLAWHTVIQFVHAEHRMPLYGKRRIDFNSVHKPVIPEESLLNKPYVTKPLAFLQNMYMLVNTTGFKARCQYSGRFLADGNHFSHLLKERAFQKCLHTSV